jgi:hypothetical protein
MLVYPEHIFTPFTSNYIEEKNILFLCFKKKISEDTRYIISNFLLTYNTGLSKYKITKKYTINNIEYKFKHSYNHPIYCVLRLLSKYNISLTNNNIIFNQILKNLNNIPNNKISNLDIFFSYLINKNKKIITYINNPTTIIELLKFIDKYICKLNYSSKFILYYYYDDYITNYQIHKGTCDSEFIINNNNTFEDLLLDNLGKYVRENNFFIKKLINTNYEFFYFEINRFYLNNIYEINYNEQIILIPKILNLQPFICYKNKHARLELICVILYHYRIKQYSIIIKDKDDFYHFLNNKIYLIDDEYFLNIISKYANILFYKKI